VHVYPTMWEIGPYYT